MDRIRAVSSEPPLLAHTSIESRGTFRQKTRSLAPQNGWACAVKICHDGMLEDTNSLDGAQIRMRKRLWKSIKHHTKLVKKNHTNLQQKNCRQNINKNMIAHRNVK